jgi:hypothetical protein
MPVMNPTGHTMAMGKTDLRHLRFSFYSQLMLVSKLARGKSNQHLNSAAGLINTQLGILALIQLSRLSSILS